MEWTNYNHLFYFWTVARNASISKASRELGLSQPTISEQLHKLEESLGVKLFERAGRGLRLSEEGNVAFHYADDIFRAGRELRAALAQRASGTPSRLVVGLSHSLAPLVASRLTAPALAGSNAPKLVCIADRLEPLFVRLALQQVEVILSDAPLPTGAKVKAFSHPLVKCGVSFLAARSPKRKQGFPQLLDRAPFLMPEPNTPLHTQLLEWFERKNLRPYVVGEFCAGLMELAGQQGTGIFAVPTLVEREACARHRCVVLGSSDEVGMEFFAITSERRLRHSWLQPSTSKGAQS
jgi:LysR family transcriptional activator of nhaA